MGTPIETYRPEPCTVGAGNLRSLPNSRGRQSHRLRHERCPWMCVAQRPGLESPPAQWTLAPGWDGRGNPTPIRAGSFVPLWSPAPGDCSIRLPGSVCPPRSSPGRRPAWWLAAVQQKPGGRSQGPSRRHCLLIIMQVHWQKMQMIHFTSSFWQTVLVAITGCSLHLSSLPHCSLCVEGLPHFRCIYSNRRESRLGETWSFTAP